MEEESDGGRKGRRQGRRDLMWESQIAECGVRAQGEECALDAVRA